MIRTHTPLTSDTLQAIVGAHVRYTGDMANAPGSGAVVAVHADRWGEFVDIILVDGRRFDRTAVCSLAMPTDERSGRRMVLTGHFLQAHSVKSLRLLADIRDAEQAAAAETARAVHQAREATRVINDPPVFLWNGIKDERGAKLQKAWFSDGQLTNHPAGTITIYARDYSRFSSKVHACFAVENRTDIMTDYFDKDTIRVIPSHPLYGAVRAALQAQNAHRDAVSAKRKR